MGKRILITESEKSNILRMYKLLNEDPSKIITIQGKQPFPKTDWDSVHGILGSVKITDDLSERVGDELKRGNYRVKNVIISSKKIQNQVITDASVELIPTSNNQIPHKIFLTRGSIGKTYVQRHDKQVYGLEDKLRAKYGGQVEVFGPYVINVEGTNVYFKQSFFAVEQNILQ